MVFYTRHFFQLSIAVILSFSLISTAFSSYRFALFAPREDPFWLGMETMMRNTCRDFAVECDVYYSYDNQFEMMRQMRKAMSGEQKVDAIIFQNFKRQGARFIQLAEEYQVAALLLNAPLEVEEYLTIGHPRERYKYWLGQILPDDEKAGYDMANILADNAIRKGLVGDDQKIRMLAINGINSDGAAIERMKGLRRALQERKDVILQQAFNGYWTTSQGRTKFLHAFGRYPQTNIVWAASDNIAIGVIQGMGMLGLKPGKDVLTGGINWSAQGIQAVEGGAFEMTIGGHLMEASWSVILLYDYFKGIDFRSEGVSFKSGMYAVQREEYPRFSQLFARKNWEKIDFKRFSKFFNPDLKHYQFDAQMILDQLKTHQATESDLSVSPVSASAGKDTSLRGTR